MKNNIEKSCAVCFHRDVCYARGSLDSRATTCTKYIDERLIQQLPLPIGTPVFAVVEILDGDSEWTVVERRFELSMIDELGETIFTTEKEAWDCAHGS